MRNSASALALQLCLDFDQPVAPAKPVAPVAPQPTLFTATVVDAAPPAREAPLDFAFAAGRTLAPSWKGRAQDNVEAIRLLNLLDREQRSASPDEQGAIARFIGFGASELANNMFARREHEFREGWEELGQALVAETTDIELQSLKRATQYAHYTPEFIIRAMWDAARTLGFTGGQVLEPGCGSGLFMGLRPDALSQDTVFVGIENDPVTARVAKALYPNQVIRCVDFDKASLPADFDLAIGNPPFSNLTIQNRTELGKLDLSLHDYFIARSLEHLRPGGIALFVTSRYSLDKSDPRARDHIDGIANFLGAVRLPGKAMRQEAGTDVVVDILLFQKHAPDALPRAQNWIELAEIPDSDEGFGPLRINRYFLDHPDHVLGRHEWRSGQFGMDYNCAADPDLDLPVVLTATLSAIASKHAGACKPIERTTSLRDTPGVTLDVQVGTAADEAEFKEGSYLVSGGVLQQIVHAIPTVVGVKSGRGGAGLFPKHAAIIKALIPIRDSVRAILRAQLNDRPYAAFQETLLTHYRQFTKKYGPINRTITSIRTDPETGAEKEYQRRPNLQPFLDDPDVWLVASIETYDEVSDTGTPGPIFTERVVKPPVTHEIHSAQDALALSLHDRGRVDLSLIAGMLGVTEAEALTDLAGDIYLDPVRSTPHFDHWVTADEVLSGPVRTKLALAREKAETDPRFAAVATALEAVQPVDLKPSEITARLGAPWIPVDVIETFILEIIEVETRILHTVELASWTVDKAPFAGHVSSSSTWGTARRSAADLLEDALNSHIPKIYDVHREADEVDGSRSWHLSTKMGLLSCNPSKEPPAMEISTIGLDLAKNVFQVHGISATGEVVIRKALRRSQMLPFFEKLPPCLVGAEACGTSHHWARELTKLGHEVRLMPAAYVKPYVKRGKNDAADAEAICEAVTRQTMRFVPIKSREQQAALSLHRVRQLLIKQRTQLVNMMRSVLAELGTAIPVGIVKALQMAREIVDGESKIDLPTEATNVVAMLAEQLLQLHAQLRKLDLRLAALQRSDERAKRLATIPGIGPIGATALAASVTDPGQFSSGRQFAAWLGLTPRQSSSGGKERLGRITKMGDRYLRQLLVIGATALVRYAKEKPGTVDPRFVALLARKPARVASVAIANKMARIAWAIMARGGVFERGHAPMLAAA